ncbi:hypothetical protein ZWY2020_014163 [Hordeum vulgare]|nr:hypothetical protein ZWY2020_014163 [Hordeum vulgare]
MGMHQSTTTHGDGPKKVLRRLPHVYSKVLELPLPADADVRAFEGTTALHFFAACGAMGEVRARLVRWALCVLLLPDLGKRTVQ